MLFSQPQNIWPRFSLNSFSESLWLSVYIGSFQKISGRVFRKLIKFSCFDNSVSFQLNFQPVELQQVNENECYKKVGVKWLSRRCVEICWDYSIEKCSIEFYSLVIWFRQKYCWACDDIRAPMDVFHIIRNCFVRTFINISVKIISARRSQNGTLRIVHFQINDLEKNTRLLGPPLLKKDFGDMWRSTICHSRSYDISEVEVKIEKIIYSLLLYSVRKVYSTTKKKIQSLLRSSIHGFLNPIVRKLRMFDFHQNDLLIITSKMFTYKQSS